MAVDTPSAIWLCAAKSLGVDFTSTATIGRQWFWVDPPTIRRVFSVLGVDRNPEEFLRNNTFAEPFFSLLGARETISLDCSSYEDASIIHDMNVPITDELRERFSVVFDGGSIEHVFNAPQAFRNCMEMVRVGGHFTQVSMANNFMGHGFWQLSPEVIFRIFSQANGYEIRAVFLHDVVGGAWYAVADPGQVHSRVELCNSRPIYILTVAKRIAIARIFDRLPQQSDYINIWDRLATQQSQQASKEIAAIRRSTLIDRSMRWRYLPKSLKRTLKVVRNDLSSLIQSGFNRPYYRRIDQDALLRGKL